MSKAVKLVTIGVVLTIITTLSITSVAFANSDDCPYAPGPAPSAGDGESENPEWGEERPNGHRPGPTPNSGDGIPGGPGW